jgi:hypothetical protein
MTSVGTLSELHNQVHMEGIISLHLKPVDGFLYVLFAHEISSALIRHSANLNWQLWCLRYHNMFPNMITFVVLQYIVHTNVLYFRSIAKKFYVLPKENR